MSSFRLIFYVFNIRISLISEYLVKIHTWRQRKRERGITNHSCHCSLVKTIGVRSKFKCQISYDCINTFTREICSMDLWLIRFVDSRNDIYSSCYRIKRNNVYLIFRIAIQNSSYDNVLSLEFIYIFKFLFNYTRRLISRDIDR